MFDVIAATNLSSRNVKDMMAEDSGLIEAIQRQTGTNLFNLTIGGKCADVLFRVRTGPGKPGKSWNLIIWIPGLESHGI